MKTGSMQASTKVGWAGLDLQVLIGQEERAHAVVTEFLLQRDKDWSRFSNRCLNLTNKK